MTLRALEISLTLSITPLHSLCLRGTSVLAISQTHQVPPLLSMLSPWHLMLSTGRDIC